MSEFLISFFDNIVDQGLEIIGLKNIYDTKEYKLNPTYKILFNAYELQVIIRSSFGYYMQIQHCRI